MSEKGNKVEVEGHGWDKYYEMEIGPNSPLTIQIKGNNNTVQINTGGGSDPTDDPDE